MFTIHNDENSQAGRRKQETNSNANGNQKRAPLGTITNRTRVQPFRNAKVTTATTDIENIRRGREEKKKLSEQTIGEQFSIFQDDSQIANNTEKSQSKQLSHALVSLSHIEISKNESTNLLCNESPMVLDLSDDEKSILDKSHERLPRDIIIDVPEYADDIYEYLRDAEQRFRPKQLYMRKQPDITTSMRSILVDWLVEVAEEYNLHRETLFLSVNYVDRFLSQMSVLRGKLQLVGAAAMFLAAKYEEIYPPEVGEFVYITDNTYTQKQVIRMEHLILKVLAFDVAVPTTNWFCDHFIKRLSADDKIYSLSMYLCELTLIDAEQFLQYLPSTIAAAAICLANISFNLEAWPASIQKETGYSKTDFTSCLHALHKLMAAAPTHEQQAVQEKYSSTSHHEVSQIEPPCLLKL